MLRKNELISQSLVTIDQRNDAIDCRQNLERWVAPIGKQPNYQMVLAYWPENHERIQLVEVFQHLDGGRVYLRIYLSPEDTFVPAIIIGDVSDIERIAQRDKQPLTLLEKGNYINQLVLSDQHTADFVQRFIDGWDIPCYEIRPCSFVLTWIETLIVNNHHVLIKAYLNQLVTGEYFAHLNTNPETEPLNSRNGVHALVVTNSETYMKQQYRLNWQQIYTERR